MYIIDYARSGVLHEPRDSPAFRPLNNSTEVSYNRTGQLRFMTLGTAIESPDASKERSSYEATYSSLRDHVVESILDANSSLRCK